MGIALEVRDLNVHLQTLGGEVQALRDVSFDIGEGEIVGLVGESGSGKSVTALSIMQLLDPDASRSTGSVVLNGKDLMSLSRQEVDKIRGRDVSMIFQEPMTALDPLFRIGDQITETIHAHQRVSRRTAEKRAIEVLTDVGLADAARRARAYPHQLSGGMRQRVMIAMALVAEPTILLADEPTTALDVTVQAQILNLLQNLSQEHGTAILLITHDLGVVAQTCSRVHTMYAGEIVEVCSVDDLLLEPKHPYSSGLIQAIPRAEMRKQALSTIPGRVPALSAMPDGCRFAPRCAHVRNECLQDQSPVDLNKRWARCCRAEELLLPGVEMGLKE